MSILAEYLPVRAMFSQTQPFGLPGHLRQLAIIRFRMIAATAIIPRHRVFVLWFVPQVQVTIGMVVAIGFAVCGAA